MTQANCADCNKKYEVPDASKTYRCKECGGRVAVRGGSTVAAPADAIDGERSCPGCGAIHFDDGVSFCEECGTSLDGSAVSPEELSERQRANRELGKARMSVRVVRFLYIFGAVGSGLLVLATLLMFTQAHQPTGVLLLLLAIGAAMLGVYTAGALRIFHQPLLWSVLIACLETVRLGLSILEGNGVKMLFLGLWTVALWSVVARVTRVRRFIHQYPELWNAKGGGRARKAALRGRPKREKPEERAHGALRQRRVAAAREQRRMGLVAAIVVVAMALVGVGWHYATRPPALEEALASFTEDWDRSDKTAVTERFAASLRPKVSRWLGRTNSRRDWSEGLPPIMMTSVTSRSSSRARVAFDTIDGVVETVWKLDENVWALASIKVDTE